MWGMKTVQKWNWKERKYYPYEIPDDWNCPLYTDDMHETINCASCGKPLKYGDCFTSREIHSSLGMGYPVCEDCYEMEFVRERKSNRGG